MRRRGYEQHIGNKTLIMGVMNITPDSFFDGSRYIRHDTALAGAEAMIADGADVIDIGGESSRPGADPVSQEDELARVLPVIEMLEPLACAVSIDTYKAETAREAIAAGATIVNDITALRGDPAMAEVVADADCDCILMHMQGMPKTMQDNPQYDDVVDDIRAFFEERLAFAVDAGINEEHLWIDPGFGFGKTVEQNLELLRRLGEFKRLGRPLLVGTSNKSLIGEVLGLPINERTEGTAATVAAAVLHGADAVRVHDVKTMARVAAMCDAIVYPEGR